MIDVKLIEFNYREINITAGRKGISEGITPIQNMMIKLIMKK